ncbi:MAG: hypothetical protein LBS24_08055 [Clostridiales Family XIII bacterium]|jgi:hypothetical protein|nr:hypothetical protein [Clostridiales Family XIII bacterium]
MTKKIIVTECGLRRQGVQIIHTRGKEAIRILEGVFKGFIQWLYALLLEMAEYAADGLLDVFGMDLAYFESTVPVTGDILGVITASGWALLLGNLVFQAAKGMMSGLGFDAEDPKELFARTFVFAFLLLASRQICDTGLGISRTVIAMLRMPSGMSGVFAALPAEDAFSIGASWLLAIIVGIVLVWQLVRLFFEIGERYFLVGFLTVTAPLAFAMGGSRSTADIFKGWARMYASMCLMMVMNVIFVKMLLSAMGAVPTGAAVLPWMIFVVAIARAARKIDGVIARIGLNPAITGEGLGRTFPGMLSYMVMRSAISNISRSAAGKSGRSAGGRPPSSPSAGGGGASGPPPPGNGASKPGGAGQRPRDGNGKTANPAQGASENRARPRPGRHDAAGNGMPEPPCNPQENLSRQTPAPQGAARTGTRDPSAGHPENFASPIPAAQNAARSGTPGRAQTPPGKAAHPNSGPQAAQNAGSPFSAPEPAGNAMRSSPASRDAADVVSSSRDVRRDVRQDLRTASQSGVSQSIGKGGEKIGAAEKSTNAPGRPPRPPESADTAYQKGSVAMPAPAARNEKTADEPTNRAPSRRTFVPPGDRSAFATQGLTETLNVGAGEGHSKAIGPGGRTRMNAATVRNGTKQDIREKIFGNAASRQSKIPGPPGSSAQSDPGGSAAEMPLPAMPKKYVGVRSASRETADGPAPERMRRTSARRGPSSAADAPAPDPARGSVAPQSGGIAARRENPAQRSVAERFSEMRRESAGSYAGGTPAKTAKPVPVAQYSTPKTPGGMSRGTPRTVGAANSSQTPGAKRRKAKSPRTEGGEKDE